MVSGRGSSISQGHSLEIRLQHELSTQDGLLGIACGINACRRRDGSRIGQREKLSCHEVTARHQPTPQWVLKLTGFSELFNWGNRHLEFIPHWMQAAPEKGV